MKVGGGKKEGGREWEREVWNMRQKMKEKRGVKAEERWWVIERMREVVLGRVWFYQIHCVQCEISSAHTQTHTLHCSGLFKYAQQDQPVWATTQHPTGGHNLWPIPTTGGEHSAKVILAISMETAVGCTDTVSLRVATTTAQMTWMTLLHWLRHSSVCVYACVWVTRRLTRAYWAVKRETNDLSISAVMTHS